MISKKLLAATALAATTALSVAGCSSNAASGGSGSGDANTLTIAATTNEKGGLDAVVADFKAANPDAKVNVTYAALDQYQTTVRTQLSSGTAPDVVFVWPGNGNPVALDVVAPAGYLKDLSTKPWASQIPDGLKPVLQLDGKSWIAPITFSGIGAIYNETALQQAGLTAPSTWSSLLQFCSDAKAKGKAAYALGAQTNWVTQLIPYALTPTLVYDPNPSFADEMTAGKATFADSAWTAALDKYTQMQKAGCFQDDPLGTSYEASLTAVAKGDALGVVQVNSAVTGITQQAPQGTTLNLLPLPATDDASQTRMAGAGGSAYGVNAKAKNPALADKFIDFIEQPAEVNKYATAGSALPAIPNTEFQVDPALKTLQQYQQEGKTNPYMDQQWPNARVQQALFSGVQDLLGGKASAADVLKQMDQAYKQGN